MRTFPGPRRSAAGLPSFTLSLSKGLPPHPSLFIPRRGGFQTRPPRPRPPCSFTLSLSKGLPRPPPSSFTLSLSKGPPLPILIIL